MTKDERSTAAKKAWKTICSNETAEQISSRQSLAGKKAAITRKLNQQIQNLMERNAHGGGEEDVVRVAAGYKAAATKAFKKLQNEGWIPMGKFLQKK